MALQQHIQRLKKKGHLKSCYLRFDDDWKRKQFVRDLRKSANIILEKYWEDNIKAPNVCEGKPALISKTSFDIYFGDNVGRTEDGRFVMRTAYGLGSGASSIGLDPRTVKVNQMFVELSSLRWLMKKLVEEHYNKLNETFCCDFNHVSVKIYYDGMKTGLHTDIEFDSKTHLPRVFLNGKSANTQRPGTPVVIVSFGDTKTLNFVRHKGYGSGTKVEPVFVVPFVQKSGSIILLDCRDENHNSRKEFWKHGSIVGMQDVTMTLMFRVVDRLEAVHPDGKLVSPKVPGENTPMQRKKKQLDRAAKLWWGPLQQQYLKQAKEIRQRIKKSFSNW